MRVRGTCGVRRRRVRGGGRVRAAKRGKRAARKRCAAGARCGGERRTQNVNVRRCAGKRAVWCAVCVNVCAVRGVVVGG